MDEKMVRKIEDEELNEVVGGMIGVEEIPNAKSGAEVNSSRIPFACRKAGCGQIFYIKMGQKDAICPACKSKYHIDG